MQDLRDAYRALRAAPLVSTVAILSLALGIGANTAIFSILNAVLLRWLPVHDPARLVVVSLSDRGCCTYAVWEQIRDRRIFDGALAWSWDRFDLARGGPTEFVGGVWTSGAFFDVLGVHPAAGRLLGEGDDRRGGGPDGPAVVISYDFWQRRFGGMVHAIGQTLTLERKPFRIVGVTPRGFSGLDVGVPFDVALPLAAMPLVRPGTDLDGRLGPWVGIMARLAPGEDRQAATARLRALQPGIREATLPDYRFARDREAFLASPFDLIPAGRGLSFLRRRYERPLLALLFIVGLVLLIACANIANLLLARTAARRHELSVRRALGATRGRLARQLLLESLLLSAIGAALGLALAAWMSRLIVAQISTPAQAAFLDLGLDGRVLGVTTMVAVVTALLFGTVPAWRAAGTPSLDSLRAPHNIAEARSGIASLLVVGQIAVSLMLVVASGLFLRSFRALADLEVGFQPDRVLVASIDLRGRAAGRAERTALLERVGEVVAATPGVEAVGASVVLPGSLVKLTRRIELPGESARPEGVTVDANAVNGDWFQALGIGLSWGREFDARDHLGAPPVAIVNQAFVRRFCGDSSGARGRIVDLGSRRSLEIVGVVGDAAYHSVRESPPPTLYLPIAQYGELPPVLALNVCVRARKGPSAAFTRSVGEAIGRADPDLSVTFRPLGDQVRAQFAQERLLALLSAFFGGLALMLAALGLYGLVAHAVARRRSEIAIRMAFGAGPAAVVRLCLGRVLGVVSLGVALGVVGSLWAGRFIGSLLYGLAPHDPSTLGAACAVLATVAVLAGWLPSRGAARTDPAVVLKEG